MAVVETGKVRIETLAVHLPPLLQEGLALVEPLAHERSVRLLPTRWHEPVGPVLADPMRLKQVLLNLLGNAIKYNRTGGTVQVELDTSGTVDIDAERRRLEKDLAAAQKDLAQTTAKLGTSV